MTPVPPLSNCCPIITAYQCFVGLGKPRSRCPLQIANEQHRWRRYRLSRRKNCKNRFKKQIHSLLGRATDECSGNWRNTHFDKWHHVWTELLVYDLLRLLVIDRTNGNGFRCNGTNIYRKNAHVLYETLPEIKNCLTRCTLGRA